MSSKATNDSCSDTADYNGPILPHSHSPSRAISDYIPFVNGLIMAPIKLLNGVVRFIETGDIGKWNFFVNKRNNVSQSSNNMSDVFGRHIIFIMTRKFYLIP